MWFHAAPSHKLLRATVERRRSDMVRLVRRAAIRERHGGGSASYIDQRSLMASTSLLYIDRNIFFSWTNCGVNQTQYLSTCRPGHTLRSSKEKHVNGDLLAAECYEQTSTKGKSVVNYRFGGYHRDQKWG
ncbi:uncharacterized protein [Anoplolepis gracilipes]|uniref:uncharacterized protein n=1 Tax=Anoplolepis gracilipes TaxID=354296 RepID=UPI003BA2B353